MLSRCSKCKKYTVEYDEVARIRRCLNTGCLHVEYEATKTDELLKSVVVNPNGYGIAGIAIAICKDLNERLKRLEAQK